MKREPSRNALANRRLYLKNSRELIDFSQENALSQVELESGFVQCSTEALAEDIVACGKTILRLESDGKFYSDMSLSYRFSSPVDLSATPTLFFAFSAYDGEHDSQYFKNVSENMYFVEKPDPLLISQSYLTVRLYSGTDFCEQTIQLTNHGFNKVYTNFAGETLLNAVDRLQLIYYIDEVVPQWQKICKLDTVCVGRTVDFTLKGSGMDTLFHTQNGTSTHQDGVLAYHFEQNSQFDFPDLTDAKDTVCDFLLSVKNTILMRLSADCEELCLRVFFKTEQAPEFSVEHSKLFTLRHAKTEQTVYLNLSDVVGCEGRLTGVRLAPQAESGTLFIKKIAFEQEHVLEKAAGRFTGCTANLQTITFQCKIEPEHIGKRLRICEIYPHLLHSDENPENLVCVAECLAEAAHVTVCGSMKKDKINRIASQFIGFVLNEDGSFLKLAQRTTISNWRELCGGNPYEFTLPAYEVDVTAAPFNALGDGFNNDTRAIQQAIDAVAAHGGGRVTVPGSDKEYGRRYMVTNLVLRSCVELHLAEGAVLWQADDLTYYDRMPRFGHNVAMTGVNWPANHTTGNLPLLYAFRLHDVKVTGPGTIRMCDTESASLDGHFEYIGDNVCIGCVDRIHTVPVAIVECDGYEISDLKVIRSSGLHFNLNFNRRGFVGNILIDQAKCTGADGMWPCGSDGAKFTRVLMNTNDDGICLSASYNDPRDVLWCYGYPGKDHGTHNIELSHSYLHCFTFTASAISFCTWGTDAPDLELEEVNDIHIFNTSLEGRAAMGGWTDNPYYGVAPFDASETDDFSPVKNIHVHDCDLQSPAPIFPLRITNFLNDFGYQSPSNFEYGDFRRRPAERNEGWRAGLSNWSYTTREAVEQILLYQTPCAVIKPVEGKVCDLYQGLYLKSGKYHFTFHHKIAGALEAFVKTTGGTDVAVTTLQQAPGAYLKGRDWNDGTLEFTVKQDGLYHIGFLCDYSKTLIAYVTDCHIQPINS